MSTSTLRSAWKLTTRDPSVLTSQVFSAYSLPPLPDSLILPPLPPIRHEGLAAHVHTHASSHAQPKRSENFALLGPGDAAPDYEKLEHVGDSLIGASVTLLLQDLYPGLGPGPATMLKGLLVRDTTLAQIAVRYKMLDDLVAERSMAMVARTTTKIQGSVFEAYVAGLFYDHMYYHVDKRATSPQPSSPKVQHSDIPLEVMITSDPSLHLKHAPSPPPASPTTPISDTAPLITPSRTRGVAFALIDVWLRKLFLPIAKWALVCMRNEQARLLGLPGAEEDEVNNNRRLEREENERATGALAFLNSHSFNEFGRIPTYTSEIENPGALEPKWRTTCVFKDSDGKTWSATASRSTKKLGSMVAAYNICRQLDLMVDNDEDDTLEAGLDTSEAVDVIDELADAIDEVAEEAGEAGMEVDEKAKAGRET